MAALFDTNEINSTFYRIPDARQTADWARRAGGANPRFRFTAKLFRGFTHEQAGRREDDRLFARRCAARGRGRLGAVLAQFPFSFHATADNRGRLRRSWTASRSCRSPSSSGTRPGTRDDTRGSSRTAARPSSTSTSRQLARQPRADRPRHVAGRLLPVPRPQRAEVVRAGHRRTRSATTISTRTASSRRGSSASGTARAAQPSEPRAASSPRPAPTRSSTTTSAARPWPTPWSSSSR